MKHLIRDPDLDPLISTSTPNLSLSNGKRNGIAINRRELKSAQVERCGKIRLVIITIIIFGCLYAFNFSTPAWKETQFLVTIPQDDSTWPGPNGKNFLII